MSLDEDWGTEAEPGGGTTLRELIAGKPLEQRRALLIIRQVLEALAATHAAGEIHRDVRPENIFITTVLGKDTVKLGSAAAAGATKTGDPVYRAPESALGAVDARADIYAVGAVLFELLTGRPPFFADDADALRRLHAYAPVQPLKQRAPGVSFADGLEATVATALAKKRDSRFGSAAAMIEAVDRALTAIGEPAPATPPSSEPGEDANDSLRLLAQDLMRPIATADASVPLVPENVGRAVPELPWRSRAGQSVRRSLARLSARLGIPRTRLVGALAAALAVGLVVAVVMCTGASTDPKQSRAVVERASAPTETNALHEQCERLGKACGRGPKRVSQIIAECRQAAAKQIEMGCAGAAIAAYNCYEDRLCGKADPVWALDDLRVLSARNARCIAEGNALRGCIDKTGR